MAAFSLSAQTYPSVRASIGLDIDDDILPDTVISLPIYHGEAERYIMRNLTEAQYESEEWADEARDAAILYLASLLAPKIVQVESEKIAGGGFMKYANVDPKSLASDLMAQANAKIADIQKATGSTLTADTNINFFGVAKRRMTY